MKDKTQVFCKGNDKKEKKEKKEKKVFNDNINDRIGVFKNKERIVFFISLIMMIISSSISVYAANYLYSSSEVSFDNSSSGISSDNVQGAIDELYADAVDYSSLESRIGVLEGRWKNSPESYFEKSGGQEWLMIKNSTSDNRGIAIKDGSNVMRGSFYSNPTDDETRVVAYNSSGKWGKGKLDLVGNPVMVNGNLVSNIIYARSSSANLNTIYSNQPDDSVYLISGQGEINLPVSGSTAIHMVISYKATNTYGYQYCFWGANIYFRSMSAGTWGSWSKIVG